MKQDRMIKDVLMKIKQRPTIRCPDEETLAAFIEGKLSDAEHTEMASHFLVCDRCRETVMAACGDPPRRLRIPFETISRATAALPDKESPWEVVVRFAADFVEVLKNTGSRTQYFAPVYTNARSGKAVEGSLVACAQSIGGIDTEVEIERIGPSTGEVKVVLKEGGGIPMPSIRVTLKSKNKELASYMAPGGAAVFERLPFGPYSILISRRGVSLGELALEMKGE